MSNVSLESVRTERGDYCIINCSGVDSFRNCKDIGEVFRNILTISSNLSMSHKEFMDIVKYFKFSDYHVFIRDAFGAYTVSAFVMYITAVQNGDMDDENNHFEKLPDNIRFIIHTNDECKRIIDEISNFSKCSMFEFDNKEPLAIFHKDGTIESMTFHELSGHTISDYMMYKGR